MVVGAARRARPRTPWTLQSTKPGTASRGPCRATGVAVNRAPQTPPGINECKRLFTTVKAARPASACLAVNSVGALSGMETRQADLRSIIRLVAILNLAYFGIEFAVAHAIGSVSLFADCVDLLEDASVNLLILVALGWSAPRRARLGLVPAGILLVPGLATL